MHKLVVRTWREGDKDYREEIHYFEYMDMLLKFLNELDFSYVVQIIIQDRKVVSR